MVNKTEQEGSSTLPYHKLKKLVTHSNNKNNNNFFLKKKTPHLLDAMRSQIKQRHPHFPLQTVAYLHLRYLSALYSLGFILPSSIEGAHIIWDCW